MPRVQAAPHRLQLVDELHGPHLRRAHQRAGGECGGKEVEGVLAGGQLALHAADDVHDVAVALDAAVGVDVDGARRGHPPEIVAGEIDQHHVLGVFLFVGEQRLLMA